MPCEDAPCCGCCPANNEPTNPFEDYSDFDYDVEFMELDDEPDVDETMDGDFDTGMASAGHGTDEDYGFYCDPEDGFY